MNVALRKPRMTRDEFFAWAQVREERYEFDGFQPVAMTGGTMDHSQIAQNLYFALRSRLAGKACRPLGPDAGIATVGNAVRYPDALVTCTKWAGSDRLAPSPVVVFEVLSPTSGRTDRIDKLREYSAVPSIRRYVILEHTSIGLAVFFRESGDAAWTATALTAGEALDIPEVGVAIPVAELYDGVDVPMTLDTGETAKP
jgi:Uma2 family endonuclease